MFGISIWPWLIVHNTCIKLDFWVQININRDQSSWMITPTSIHILKKTTIFTSDDLAQMVGASLYDVMMKLNARVRFLLRSVFFFLSHLSLTLKLQSLFQLSSWPDHLFFFSFVNGYTNNHVIWNCKYYHYSIHYIVTLVTSVFPLQYNSEWYRAIFSR